MTFNSAQLEKLTPEQVRDIAEGKIRLMDVLGVTPGEMLHHLETALNLIAVNKLDDATRILKGLSALDVRNPAFASALGSVELLKRNYEPAIDLAQRAIQIDPKFVTGYYVLGEALAQVKRNDEAVAAFEKAFELSPHDGSRDAKRCRTIYVGLTGKMAPAPPPMAPVAAGAPGRPPAPVAAGAPGRPPAPVAAGAPRPAPIAPRSAPAPMGRAGQGGAFNRPAAAPAMVSRAGGGAPMRA
jgi:tetratricopeptide (TPR) repeat protein